MDTKPADDVSEEDANKLLARLKGLADQWKNRLADPVVRQMVKDGRMAVSPLVKELIAAFAEKKK